LPLSFAMRAKSTAPAAIVAALGVLAAPTLAWARSPVVIEGVDHDMRVAIMALLPDRDAPTSLFDAERISEEAAARATAYLRSEGYYAATVTPDATETPPSARLVIALGERFIFGAPQIVFEGDAPDASAINAAHAALGHVAANTPARAADVLEAEGTALAALQELGYADAAAGERRVVVDHATGRVNVEYHLNAGTLAHLGRVRAEPSTLFRRHFVSSLQNWEDGELYHPQSISRLRRDIVSTGAVSVATTHLAPPGANGVRDVIIDVEPARRNAYELGFSYSTTDGAGVEAEWTRRNLTGRADSLTLNATLAEMQQSLGVEWALPHAAGLDHTVRYGATIGREDLDAYTHDSVALYASVDAMPRIRVGRSYGVRLSTDHYDNTTGGVQDAVVLSGFGDLRNDSTEASLDPRDGSIVDLRVEPSVSTGDETLGFVRGIADARVYESLLDHDALTLAARAKIGWLEALAGNPDDVPPDRRFYAGGGGSVRGYTYNSIYPHERDALGLAPGGQGLVEGSIEARWRFSPHWGAAAFVDGGSAFDDWSNATDFRWGVGVGVRYDLGFAPLRFDIAVPLDRDEAHDDFALYVSLGQAF